MKQTLIISVMPLQQSEVKNLKFVDYHICDENLPNFKDKFKQYQRLLNFEILSSKISSALLRISQRTTYLSSLLETLGFSCSRSQHMTGMWH